MSRLAWLLAGVLLGATASASATTFAIVCKPVIRVDPDCSLGEALRTRRVPVECRRT